MATKTFEELKQLAIQIRDEKTNKQNTATRVGTAMLEHINKLEQDYYDKTQTDEELKERDDKLTELEEKSIYIKKKSGIIYGRDQQIIINSTLLKKNSKIYYKSNSSNVLVYLFREDGSNESLEESTQIRKEYYITEDFKYIRFYKGGETLVDQFEIELTIVPQEFKSIFEGIEVETYPIYEKDRQIEYRYDFKEGQILRCSYKILEEIEIGSAAFYMFRSDGTYQSFTIYKDVMSEIYLSESYDYAKLFISHKDDLKAPLCNLCLELKNLPDLQKGVSGISTPGVGGGSLDEQIKLYAEIKKGCKLIYRIEAVEDITSTNSYAAYLFRKDGSYVSIPSPNAEDNEYICNEDFLYMRVYLSHQGDSKSQKFQLYLRGIYNFPNIIKITDENNLRFILPDKFFMVNGMEQQIFAHSILPNADTDIDIFTYPMSESNFDADEIHEGKNSVLKNLKDCILRIGFIHPNLKSYMLYKDVSVVWLENPNGVIKKALVIGDSITNRGVAYFVRLAAQKVGATINMFGTCPNYNSTYGEGHEGWTWGNFIGQRTKANNTHITYLSDGLTEGGAYINAFMRKATESDKSTYPDFCFPNTDSENETPYSENSDKEQQYYIFDFDYYLKRWGDEKPNIPDAITIALNTNDINHNISVDDVVKYSNFMVQRIQQVVPNAKVGIIPSPTWGAGMDFEKVITYIDAIRSNFKSNDKVDIIGAWAFISRYHAFGLKDKQNIGTDTINAKYQEGVHYDTGDGGKKTYIPYGKVVASYILNS